MRIAGAELLRWYWLRDELAVLARQLGISAGGSKQELTARIVARLEGRPPPPPPRRRPPAAGALPEPLTPATPIPAGQRCTQQLRRYLTGAVGPQFRFDAPMRAFFADARGRTLGDAVEHWRSTRSQGPTEIAPQFELNRFLRHWHREHPDRSRREALSAWHLHRDAPVDARDTLGGASAPGPATVRP